MSEPRADVAHFRRTLSRALHDHGEWCYWRRTVKEDERERLAEVANDSERRVIEMYEAAVGAGAGQAPPAEEV